MKKIICYFIFFITSLSVVFSQIELKFTSRLNTDYKKIDSVLVVNLSNNNRLKLLFPDTTLRLKLINDPSFTLDPNAIFFQNFPNPFTGKTYIYLNQQKKQLVQISVYNGIGKLVCAYRNTLDQGIHTFTFNAGNDELYFFKAQTGNTSNTIKLLQNGKSHTSCSLIYNGSFLQGSKNTTYTDMEYMPGDHLMFVGYITSNQNMVLKDTIYDEPFSDNCYTYNFYTKNKILILNYHAIVNTTTYTSAYQRNVNDFKNDMLYFKNHNFELLSLNDIRSIVSGEKQLNSNAVVITFDDGFTNNYTLAFPILKELNIPATFFVVTDWIGKSSGYMNWDQLMIMNSYLNDEGKQLFTIGSHSNTHPYLGQSALNFSTTGEYISFLEDELGTSKDIIISHTGQSEIFLALPFGDGYNSSYVYQTAMNLGYTGIRRSLWKAVLPEEINLFHLPGCSLTYETPVELLWLYFE